MQIFHTVSVKQPQMVVGFDNDRIKTLAANGLVKSTMNI